MKNIKYLLLLSCILTLSVAKANPYSINHTDVINVSTGYINNMTEVWNVTSNDLTKPIKVSYTIGTEANYDFLEIYSLDNQNNAQLILKTSGTNSGVLTTKVPSGKARIIFRTDGSVNYQNNPAQYFGINVSFAVDNDIHFSNSINSATNMYVNGLLGIGTINPQAKVDVVGDIHVGVNSKIKLMDFPGQGAWIDIPIVPNKASGIGSGGAGSNAWIGYAGVTNQWFTGSAAGDICYRNTNGKLLFGNSSGASTMSVTSNRVGIGTTSPTSKLHIATVNGEGIRIGKIGDAGNINVPIDALTSQYNIDFTGFRDISTDQIGARISALRFNCYQANNAYVQKTGLAFYTNPKGENTGTTDLIERMRIAPDGKIGIGTDNIQSNLHLVAPASYAPINAFTLDVNSFSTVENMNVSTFFRVRDIGAGKTPFVIKGNGFVGIGTDTPDHLLTVKGTIHAREVLVDLNGPLADYVFEPDYALMPLSEVESFVKANKHLPEIPSAAEVKENGLNMGEMQNKLLQKIEELTLYVIELQKTNEKQNAEIEALKQVKK